jgi:hypothetical protein
MSPDHIDDLDLYRARRDRDRQASDPGTVGDDLQSTEQRDAIARARESWALSQLGREARAPRGRDRGTPRDALDDAQNVPSDD